jgi:hypothetical protein
MQIKHPRKTFAALLLVGSLASPSYGYASTLTIDNFTHAQSVTDSGRTNGSTTNTLEGLTGTDLSHASRTFTARATTGSARFIEDIVSGYDKDAQKYVLKVSNGTNSAGSASILWNFDPINFTQHGDAIQLEVLSIGSGVSVEMVANGVASSGVKVFNGTGNFLVNFDDFTNSSAFDNVSSFRLNFAGPAAWDGKFKILTSFAPPVPVPPAFALMGSALLGIMGFARGKTRLISYS